MPLKLLEYHYLVVKDQSNIFPVLTKNIDFSDISGAEVELNFEWLGIFEIQKLKLAKFDDEKVVTKISKLINKANVSISDSLE